jgi:hypothetical protein
MAVPCRTAQCCCTCTVLSSNTKVPQQSIPKVASSSRRFKTDGQTDRQHSALYKQFFLFRKKLKRSACLPVCLSVCHSIPALSSHHSVPQWRFILHLLNQNQIKLSVSQSDRLLGCLLPNAAAHFNVLCRNKECQRPCFFAMNQNPQMFDLPCAEVVAITDQPRSM